MERIEVTEITYTDLAAEAAQNPGAEAGWFRYEGGQRGEALYVPEAGRIGVATGGNAVWFRATGLEEGVERLLSGEEVGD